MNNPLKRSWLRFGLRTMFVVVVIAAIPLTYIARQMQIVFERKSLIAQLNELAIGVAGKIEGLETEEKRGILLDSDDPQLESLRVSRLRRWLGDESYLAINVHENVGRDLLRRVEYAFPEAQITVYSMDRTKVIGVRSMPRNPPARNDGDIFETGLKAPPVAPQ